MNKTSIAVIAGVIASSAVGGVAAADTPGTTPAAISAQAAITAATTSLMSAGTSGLISSGALSFQFTVAAKTCPAGTTNPSYCADNASGGFRFILRVKDIRPGSKGNFPVIATFLTGVKAGSPFNSDTCQPINANATGCPLTIRPKGTAILTYARDNNASLPALLIAHIRPNGSATSTEVLQVLNL